MESRVDIVTIEGDVTLDIMALTRYNGQGRCAELRLHDKHKTTSSRNAEERYKKEDWSWAQKIIWSIASTTREAITAPCAHCCKLLTCLIRGPWLGTP